MGSGVHEGTVVEWKKSAGDAVSKGEVLLDAESEKVDFEIESPADGVLTRVLIEAGTEVPVGEVLGLLETEAVVPDAIPELELSDSSPEPGNARPTSPPKSDEWVAPVAPLPPREARSAPTRAASTAATGRSRSRSTRLSPRARRLLEEHGLSEDSVARIPGTGAGGRVTARDVEAFAHDTAAPLPGALLATNADSPTQIPVVFRPLAEGEPLETREVHGPVRRRIAERLSQSAREIPQVTNHVDVDLAAIATWRQLHKDHFQRRHAAPLTYTPFFALAIIAALRDPAHSRFNGTYEEDAVVVKRFLNLGVAVDAPQGLVVPVLRGADQLDFVELVRGLEDLTSRARAGKLYPGEMREGTISLSNFGVAGVVSANPLINPPQLAIVGTGALVSRVVALPGDTIGIRPVLQLCVTFDHRANDGGAAGRFASAMGAALERMDLTRLHY